MTWFEAVFLGFLQGATEFLPVSSSGHLVLGQAALGVEAPGAGLEVALHGSTLLSVIIVYRDRIGALIGGVARGEGRALRYAGLLAIASVPAAVAGLGLGDLLESLFDRPAVAGAGLLLSGVIAWTARKALARGPAGKLGAGTALAMGLAQAAAIVPGVSRSGSTVVTGLWRGVDPSEAAAFSFLMSIPVVGGAVLLRLSGGMSAAGAGIDPVALALAAATACATGVAAIAVFRATLRRRSFHRFAPYLWVVGAASLLTTWPW